MSKLFKLKKWLTISEAQKHLTTLFGETVSKADIFRLALDHQLKLSVVFVQGAFANVCKRVDATAVEYIEVPSLIGGGIVKLPVGGEVLYALDGQLLQVQKEVIPLEEDWPYALTMIGGERADIEHTYWQLSGIESSESTNLDGIFVSDGNETFRLMSALPRKKGEQAKFYPIGGLPKNAAMVVTTNALLALEKAIEEGETNGEKQLSTRERDNLLKLVIGMAIAGYRYDPAAAKSTAPKEIANDIAKLGMSLSDDTVRKYLKEATESVMPAMPRKS